MALVEEAEILQALRKGFERGEIEASLVSTAGQFVETIFKDFNTSSSKVNNLLEDVFLLESKLKVDSLGIHKCSAFARGRFVETVDESPFPCCLRPGGRKKAEEQNTTILADGAGKLG